MTDTDHDRTRLTLYCAAFLAVIVAANILTTQLGIVHWLGITATAGTWVAGFAFVARDAIHDTAGQRWVLAMIGAGAILSAAISPRIALASGVAFALSELADFAVYTPLRRRGRTRAALASNLAGAAVDTLAFLAIAGFPLTAFAGQMIVKVGVTSIYVGARRVLLREPLR